MPVSPAVVKLQALQFDLDTRFLTNKKEEEEESISQSDKKKSLLSSLSTMVQQVTFCFSAAVSLVYLRDTWSCNAIVQGVDTCRSKAPMTWPVKAHAHS